MKPSDKRPAKSNFLWAKIELELGCPQQFMRPFGRKVKVYQEQDQLYPHPTSRIPGGAVNRNQILAAEFSFLLTAEARRCVHCTFTFSLNLHKLQMEH